MYSAPIIIDARVEIPKFIKTDSMTSGDHTNVGL